MQSLCVYDHCVTFDFGSGLDSTCSLFGTSVAASHMYAVTYTVDTR